MDVFDLVYGLGFASIIGLLAARKQRNGWEWGFVSLFPIAVFGTDAFGLLLLVVLLVRPCCPKCGHVVPHQAVSQQNCPHCHYHGRIGLLSLPLQNLLQSLSHLVKGKYRSSRRAKTRRSFSR